MRDKSVFTTNEDVKFINISPGLYDDTMKCPNCNFAYENRADNDPSENTENSKHICEDHKS